eukprot:UN25306
MKHYPDRVDTGVDEDLFFELWKNIYKFEGDDEFVANEWQILLKKQADKTAKQKRRAERRRRKALKKEFSDLTSDMTTDATTEDVTSEKLDKSEMSEAPSDANIPSPKSPRKVGFAEPRKVGFAEPKVGFAEPEPVEEKKKRKISFG